MKHFKDHNPIVLLFLNLTIGNTILKDDFFVVEHIFHASD